ncbi:hypothetical protein [Novosphingobium sp. 9]|uniref:hypothetical protein n=1 Tax=Novosphingobium sp. 9 TaxID=2025349 RepID=UPI0021B6447B|nr:hypothetical protein [Novosphingobium sp. 9]
MFRDFREDFLIGADSPPPPETPQEPGDEPQRPPLGPRREKIVLAILGFNMLMLFLAPLAGVTLFDWVACYD